MCENISFVKSAVGFGVQNSDPTLDTVALYHLKYQTYPGNYSEKGLEKCVPVLRTVSLPSEHCPVLWVSLGPSLRRVCTWHCGAEPCSVSFMS